MAKVGKFAVVETNRDPAEADRDFAEADRDFAEAETGLAGTPDLKLDCICPGGAREFGDTGRTPEVRAPEL
ncbi:unnamed protein product [Sphagnum balticum]